MPPPPAPDTHTQLKWSICTETALTVLLLTELLYYTASCSAVLAWYHYVSVVPSSVKSLGQFEFNPQSVGSQLGEGGGGGRAVSGPP